MQMLYLVVPLQRAAKKGLPGGAGSGCFSNDQAQSHGLAQAVGDLHDVPHVASSHRPGLPARRQGLAWIKMRPVTGVGHVKCLLNDCSVRALSRMLAGQRLTTLSNKDITRSSDLL